MKPGIAALALLLVAVATPCAAQDDAVRRAGDALRDGFPQAALAPLQQALRSAPAGRKHEIGLLLARAQLAAGRPADALKTLEAACDGAATETAVVRASALAAQGATEEAVKIASKLAPENPAAALLLARIRFEQGDLAGARELLPDPAAGVPEDPNILRLLLDWQFAAGKPDDTALLVDQAREKSLLPAEESDVALGRLRLAQNRPADAADIFRGVLAAGKLSGPVRDNARMGLTRALLALGVDSRARDVLREGIAEAPDSPTMRESLEQWILLESRLGTDPITDLRAWAAEKGTRRAFEAALQLARLDIEQKRLDPAGKTLEAMSADPAIRPDDLLRVRLLLAEGRIAGGQPQAALEILDGLPAVPEGSPQAYRVADAKARALAASGARKEARDAFLASLRAARTPAEISVASGNTILAALAADDLALARKTLDLLRAQAPADPELVRLAFLLAAAEARAGDTTALAALAGRPPAAEFAFEAKLALAQWRLARGEPAAAERILRTAEPEADNEVRAAALAAAEIFAADNSGSRSREEVVALCREFLDRHPQAADATDVAFKLGEILSREGNHSAAESVYISLAARTTDPESAALAKYLAAQSASRSMSPDGAARALQWLDQIAQTAGPLRHRARLDQASLLARDRRHEDALTLYDQVLAAEPPPEIRHAALMEKGDTLFALGAAGKAGQFEAAAQAYAALAGRADAPADWRDQAACKKAAALAQAGRPEEALAEYRAILARPAGEGADTFWFYKAGLEAALLLEQQRDWPAAIAVYDQLASAEGPQREELRQRARRLRLEHFIWEN